MTDKLGFDETLVRSLGLSPSEGMGVAVSGGSDSLALLCLLSDWGGCPLRAVTVDHGLRAASASEALHVARICDELGVPHEVLTWQGWDGKGNVQAEARRTRYALIAEWAQAHGLGAVALGHTLDDQAETFLMRLAREAGVDGLSAMAPEVERHGVRFFRPLLQRRRVELRNALEQRGLRWIDDPTNEDEAFERVRARRVLGALDDLGITAKTLAAVAGNLGEARNALADATASFAQDHAKVDRGDLIFDRARLNRLSSEIRRRVLAGALRWIASADYPPRREPLSDVEAACDVPRNVTLHGCLVLVSDMTVRVVREHAATTSAKGATNNPWDSRWFLDGPHDAALEVRALGEGLRSCPDWRDRGMPRASLLASPSIWRGETLVAAPIAGLENGWTARTRDLAHFVATLIAH